MRTLAARMTDWFDDTCGEWIGGACHLALLLGAFPVDIVLNFFGLPEFVPGEEESCRG